jgi:hypothetical protein
MLSSIHLQGLFYINIVQHLVQKICEQQTLSVDIVLKPIPNPLEPDTSPGFRFPPPGIIMYIIPTTVYKILFMDLFAFFCKDIHFCSIVSVLYHSLLGLTSVSSI